MLDPLNRRRFLGVTGAAFDTAVLRARSHLPERATATRTVTVG